MIALAFGVLFAAGNRYIRGGGMFEGKNEDDFPIGANTGYLIYMTLLSYIIFFIGGYPREVSTGYTVLIAAFPFLHALGWFLGEKPGWGKYLGALRGNEVQPLYDYEDNGWKYVNLAYWLQFVLKWTEPVWDEKVGNFVPEKKLVRWGFIATTIRGGMWAILPSVLTALMFDTYAWAYLLVGGLSMGACYRLAKIGGSAKMWVRGEIVHGFVYGTMITLALLNLVGGY